MPETFLASELIYAASLCRLKYLYGIPDVLSSLTEEVKAEAIQEAVQSLMSKNYISMDMDGNFTVSETLSRILYHCSNCDEMLSASVRLEDGTDEVRAIWKMKDSYLQGIVNDGSYQFMYLTAQEVRNILDLYSEYEDDVAAENEMISIPYAVLRKAKRFKKSGNVDAVVEQLGACGVSQAFAEDIALSLFEKNAFYMFSLIFPEEDDVSCKSCSFAKGRQGYISMQQEVIDFKTNIVFSYIDPCALQDTIRGLFAEFTEKSEV